MIVTILEEYKTQDGPRNVCSSDVCELGPAKRAKLSQSCIIHYVQTNKDSNPISLRDMKSWQSLLKAANIRKHEPLLQIAKTVPDNVVPNIFYHRQCRILFMMKRDLHQIIENEEIDKEIN